MNEKFISGYRVGGGYSNILMALENLLAFSAVTERRVLLPNYTHDGPKSDFPLNPRESIWSVLDIESIKKNFLCEEWGQYTDGPAFDFSKNIDSAKTCYYNSSLVSNYDDFGMFTKNRPIVDIGKIEDFIISFSYLDYYYYKIYTGAPTERNIVKKKINDSIKYKEKYISLSQQLITEKYNAVHVRYPGFTGQLDVIGIKKNPIILLNQLQMLFDRDTPLFISTDIKSTMLLIRASDDHDFDDYMNPIKRHFKKVIFLEDFGLDLTHTEKIALDQLLCINADKFYGTYYSTFSKRINVMRGSMGKESHDYMGWNKIQTAWQEEETSYPWNKLNGEWPFQYSSYLSYKLE